jgi:hypothetical protein
MSMSTPDTQTPKPGTANSKLNDSDFVKFDDPKLLNSSSVCSSTLPENCTKPLYKLTGGNMIIYPPDL